MKLKKFLLILLIVIYFVSMLPFSIAQDNLPETIIGDGETAPPDSIEIQILKTVSALSNNSKDSVSTGELNENFAQLDRRLQLFQGQTVAFLLMVLLVNDILIFSAYFILKGRGIL